MSQLQDITNIIATIEASVKKVQPYLVNFAGEIELAYGMTQSKVGSTPTGRLAVAELIAGKNDLTSSNIHVQLGAAHLKTILTRLRGL